VRISDGRRISIRSKEPTAFFGDGAIKEIGTSFQIEVIPDSLAVLVPRKREVKKGDR
jgi:diacylglycerol kinase family enzyme